MGSTEKVGSGHRCTRVVLFRCDRFTRFAQTSDIATLLVMNACDYCVCRAHSYYGLSFDFSYDLLSDSL